MRIRKRAAWRKKLLKSSSEFSAIQEDSLLRLGILFLSCLCDCGAGVSLLRERQGGNENRRSLRSPLDPFARRSPCFLNFFVTSGNVDRVAILWINTRA